jgi:hypothetical protein
MSVKSAQYMGPLSQDNGRGPSMSIWGDFNADDALQKTSGLGSPMLVEFWEDFCGGQNVNTTNAVGSYVGDHGWGTWIDTGNLLGATADTTNLPLEGGVLASLPNSTSQTILSPVGGAGFGFLDASSTSGNFRGKMWFECSLAISSIAANSSGLFIGLCGKTSDVTGAAARLLSATAANGLIHTNDFFGFYKPVASGMTNNASPSKVLTGSLVSDFLVAYCVNGGTTQFPGSASNLWKLLSNTGSVPLVAATFTAGNFTTVATMKVKLGWVFDPTPSVPQLNATAAITSNQTVGTLYKGLITFYVNGQRSSAFLVPADVQASTFPSGWMSPVIGHVWGSSGAGTAYFDWIRVGQLGTY